MSLLLLLPLLHLQKLLLYLLRDTHDVAAVRAPAPGRTCRWLNDLLTGGAAHAYRILLLPRA